MHCYTQQHTMTENHTAAPIDAHLTSHLLCISEKGLNGNVENVEGSQHGRQGAWDLLALGGHTHLVDLGACGLGRNTVLLRGCRECSLLMKLHVHAE